ncbi:metallophosphatase domain-containing protein [Mesonia aestuariivivens]|uniref:Metallophosphatase domain-containing protein n=1 Tax=Mesonia aestuariivivens TaxID=2796128 RepID=A0ABS6W3N0_9FLAO|nr:metallophosphatase domain-containing protein [Mesonia aestuariivivens]MBW2962466.1 metallophosphatase domain-containing protein [Mesonia aestuariivivens]
MKITCVSDTHNLHEKIILPTEGDVIIHAGDSTEGGTKRELKNFLKWFSALPFKHKIFIAGNHDFFLENISAPELHRLIPKNVTYLKDNGITIEGVKFWGSPYIPSQDKWAFTKPVNKMEAHWEKIPDNVDILITHTPPKGILDETNRQVEIGCPALAKEILNKKPKVHVFGHLHENYGTVKLQYTTYINATSFFKDLNFINMPITLNFTN